MSGFCLIADEAFSEPAGLEVDINGAGQRDPPGRFCGAVRLEAKASVESKIIPFEKTRKNALVVQSLT